ncbi:MAG: hypothetical protein AAFZ99_10000 [Pseudomonadota bacterium]
MNDALFSTQPGPERPNLIREEDDFSVKLTLDGDPKFWWRVEKSHDESFLITDFMPGAQDDHTMAAALTDLATQAGHTPPFTVIFHDLVPGSPEPGAYRIRLNDVSQSIDRWSRLAAVQLNLTLADTQLLTHRGKARMVVKFE